MNPGQYGLPQGSPYGAPMQPQQHPLQQQQQPHQQQPQQHQQQQQQHGSAPATSASPTKASFFKGLLDLSFSTFVTPSVAKVLYVLLVVIAALAALGMLGSGAMAIVHSIEYERWSGILTGLGMMILSPIAFILYVIVARIYMEVLIVLFRIANDIRELNQKTRG